MLFNLHGVPEEIPVRREEVFDSLALFWVG